MTSEKKAPQDLAHIFHIRNLTAKYRNINSNLGYGRFISKVGFFWMDISDCKVYGKFIDFNQGEYIRLGNYEFIIHPDSGHYGAWTEIMRQNPKWEDQHYEDIPRGRIVFYLSPNVKKCEFRVYMCPLLNSSVYENLIIRKCFLPQGYFRFLYDDEHYQLRSQI